MQEAVLDVIVWWLTIFVVGLINLSLTWRIFRKFTDLGYAFSKILGILLISYVVFLLGIFKIAPLSNPMLYFVITILVACNLIIFVKLRRNIISTLRENFTAVVVSELLFSFGFIFWSYVKGFQPDINGLEKFMDYGFINSILKSRSLPPFDMWFAGRPINYYWFGHFVTAVIIKLTKVPSAVSYNLMLATIMGLTLSSAFSIVSSLVKNLNSNIKKRAIFLAGILSAILLTFGGNLHTPIYALKNGIDNYWYPDATRFIGYNPETNDKTIHEFPMYSFVVSDLHAHLLNLPIVLLYIAVLFKIISESKNLRALFLPGFILGVMFMTNTWDFANYSLLTGISVLVSEIKKRGFNLSSFLSGTIYSAITVTIGVLFALPFIINFESLAQGIKLSDVHTPLWQLGVLWGFPFLLTLVFSFYFLAKRKEIKLGDLFILCLFVASWMLIFIPEVVYVKDIYIASHKRANTMFKLTYQAFVMFYLTSGYVAVRTLLLTKSEYLKGLLILFFSLIFALILWYPKFAIKSYYAELKTYKGLDGEAWLKTKNPETYKAVSWLRDNVKGQAVILEAAGDSYTEYNVVSSYTGLPTISGWFVHEWLWRGSSSFPQERSTEIANVYTSGDINLTKNILKKYKVEYVIVGKFEKEKYKNVSETKFNQLGKVVFASGNTKIYKIN